MKELDGRLSDEVSEMIRAFPEAGYGVHRVTLVLRDGSRVPDVDVAWGSQLVRGPATPMFRADEVVDALDESGPGRSMVRDPAESLVQILDALVVVLRAADQAAWSRELESIASGLLSSADDPSRQELVRRVLHLYGGMGRFDDLVLQTPRGVRPEQDEFDRLRADLFEEARRQLR
jgi:hypothetical protein